MPYLGSTPARGLVGTANIDDNAVTLAKLAGGTDGNIISFDSSGDPVAVAVGTSGHFLKSQGAGSQPVFADASSPLEFVSSSTASSSASVALTGIDNTADTWMVLIEGANVQTDAKQPWIRTSSDTSSHSYDSGSSDYCWSFNSAYGSSDTGYNKHDTADSEIQMGKDALYPGNDATSALSARVFIHNPSVTTYHTTISFDCIFQGTSQESHRTFGSGQRLAAEAVTAIQFLMESGNFDTGKFSLFKIKHA